MMSTFELKCKWCENIFFLKSVILHHRSPIFVKFQIDEDCKLERAYFTCFCSRLDLSHKAEKGIVFCSRGTRDDTFLSLVAKIKS
jgi:hypothetical protein